MKTVETLKQILDDQKGSAVNKFGYNNDVDTTTDPEDIWSVGGLYPYSTFSTAQNLEVVSSLAADTVTTGTGAWSVTISGLDANLNSQSVSVDLTGTTAVEVTGTTWLAVNRAFINEPTGTGGTNAGVLTIRVSGGGTTVAEIPATRGQTQQCVYRVPDGLTLRVVELIAYTDAATGKTASMQLVRVGNDCSTTRVISSGTLTENSAWRREYIKGGPQIEGGAWVAVRALSVAQNDTAITADFDGVLE